MRKTTKFVSGVAIPVLAIAVTGCAAETSGAGGGDTIVLSYGNSVSPEHPMNANALVPWAEKVEEETDGRIKIEPYYNAALGDSLGAWEDVQNGIYDMGLVNLVYHYDNELLPLSIATLPGASNDDQASMDALTQYADEVMEDSVWENAVNGSFSSTDANVLMASFEATELADLENKQVRSGGQVSSDTLTGLGAVPVSVPQEDMYTALQRGTIDGSAYTMVGAFSRSLEEVAPNILIGATFSHSSFFNVVNRAKLEEMPDDLRTQFEGLVDEFGELVTTAYTDAAGEYLNEYKDTAGSDATITELSATDQEKFNEVAAESWENWIELANEAGYDGKELASTYASYAEEVGGFEVPY